MSYIDTEIAGDYQVVRRAIELISENWREQPELEELAIAVGRSPSQLQKIFTRWAGLSPKAFLQAVTLDHARRLLNEPIPILDAAYELGLSGPGRLHDLFVTHEAMSPGVYKAKGEGLQPALRLSRQPVRPGAGDDDGARPRRPGILRSGRRASDAAGHDGALAEGSLQRGQGCHRRSRAAVLRSVAVARRKSAARRHDRHRLSKSASGRACLPSRSAAPRPIRTSPPRSARPTRPAPLAGRSDATRCPSSCRATE